MNSLSIKERFESYKPITWMFFSLMSSSSTLKVNSAPPFMQPWIEMISNRIFVIVGMLFMK